MRAKKSATVCTVLLLVVAALFAGCGQPGSNNPANGQQGGAPSANAKPLSKAEQLDLLNWVDQKVSAVNSRFAGLTPQTYKTQDPGWDSFVTGVQDELKKKEQSLPKPPAGQQGTGGEWKTEGEVQLTLSVAIGVLTNIQNYLQGKLTSDEVAASLAQYKTMRQKAMQDLQGNQMPTH